MRSVRFETALREMNEVMAIIYDCPQTTDVPLPIRANWIRTLYPSVQVVKRGMDQLRSAILTKFVWPMKTTF